MYSLSRRYRSSPHLSSDNVNITGKHVDTPQRDTYMDLLTSSKLLDERISGKISSDGVSISTDAIKDQKMKHNSYISESPRVGLDTYLAYGSRARPPERGKWLAYAKNIKPRRERGSNLIKTRSMENIDISSKYPRLQNSNFYQNLHKKYPQAFQRRVPPLENKTRRPSRRLFNSGLRVHFQDNLYDSEDTRSVCSERPMSNLERDLSEFLGYNNVSHDRDCRTSPTPSMMSDLSVKERLDATSDKLYHLLYNGIPRSCHKGSYDPEVTPRSRRSRAGSVSSDLHSLDDLDRLSSPRHLDPYQSLLDTSIGSMTHEDHIRSLQKELELKDKELRAYREKLHLNSTVNGHGSNNIDSKHSQEPDSTFIRMLSPESPPDSAIDVDSSSVRSVTSMDTKYFHSIENQGSSTGILHSEESVTSQKNGYLPIPVHDGSYFVNDNESFVYDDVIQEEDEEGLTIEKCSNENNKSEDTTSVKDSEENLDSEDNNKDEDVPEPQAATPSLPDTDTEAVMEQIVQQTMSRLHDHSDAPIKESNPPYSHVHFDDDVDDSDPRLGIPEVKSYNENLLQERYHQKRARFHYHKRRCITPRERSEVASVLQNCSHSDDPVSILCSPRPVNISEVKDHDLERSDFHRSNISLNVVPEKQNLATRRLVSESDIRNIGVENQGIFFMKSSHSGSVSSFQSDLSTNTLVASQQTLTEVDAVIAESDKRSFPKVTLHSHSPRKKFRFKKLFKGKKGHYNPSHVEDSQPVDLEAMLKYSSLPDLSDRMGSNQNIYSVQYENSKHGLNNQYHSGNEKSPNETEGHNPHLVNRLHGANILSSQDDDYIPKVSGSGLNDCIHNQLTEKNMAGAEVPPARPPPPYRLMEDGQLTAYEAAVVNLDDHGVDIDELIDSDSDNVFSAKCVVIDRQRKNNTKHKRKSTDSDSVSTKGSGTGDQSHVEITEDRLVTGNTAIKTLNDSFTSDEQTDEDVDYAEKGMTEQIEPNQTQSSSFEQSQNQIEKPAANSVIHIDSPCDATQGRSSNDYPTQGKSGIVDEVQVSRDNNEILVDSKSDNIENNTDKEQICMFHTNNGSFQGTSTEEGLVQETGRNEEPVQETRIDKGQGDGVVTLPEDSISRGSSPVSDSHGVTSAAGETGARNGSFTSVTVHSDSGARPRVTSDVDTYHVAVNPAAPNTAKGGDSVIKTAVNDDSITVMEENQPVPQKDSPREESNLVKSKALSVSKQSLSDKVKKSAKSKFKAIRKAVSLDKGLNKAGADDSEEYVKEKKTKSVFKIPKIKKAPALKNLFQKKKSKPPMVLSDTKSPSVKVSTEPIQSTGMDKKDEGHLESHSAKWSSCHSLESLDLDGPTAVVQETYPMGKLLTLNCDGTQSIEINKHKHGPMGFFIARGNAQFNHGVFVSRFAEGPHESMYSGLLSVGDEILEINKFVLKDLALDDIYDIMATKDTLVMKVLPLMARKDI